MYLYVNLFCDYQEHTEYFNKTQNNRHSENCKHFHSLRFNY
jgi:hypothetical protein